MLLSISLFLLSVGAFEVNAASTSTSTSTITHHELQAAAELLRSAGFQIIRPQRHLEQPEQEVDDSSSSIKRRWYIVFNAVGAAVCVLVSALAAGLTVGLLSLDPLMLLIKTRAGATLTQREQAGRLVPIIQRRHLLLVTLLLLNSLSSEALPIFLNDLVPDYVAVLLSVVLVLVFGEILPSAVFTGPKQLQMASRLAPLVNVCLCIVYPIAYPISLVLDWLLHDDDAHNGTSYNRGELSALIRIQYEERLAQKMRKQQEYAAATTTAGDHYHPPLLDLNASIKSLKQQFSSDEHPEQHRHHRHTSSLHIDEINMMEGALQMKTKVAFDIYTSLKRVFCVPDDMLLDEGNITKLYSSGYSRVPVYGASSGKKALRGVLMTRQLIVVNTSDNIRVSSLPWNIPNCVPPTMNLVDLVNLFQTGGKSGKGGHLAFVCANPDIGNAALEEHEAIPEEAGLMG
jgi:metal transporter CNNM